MLVIDCHSHYEPEILDSSGILARMKNYNIDMTALMSKVTTRPIYKKSEFLMMAHRNILKNNVKIQELIYIWIKKNLTQNYLINFMKKTD